MNTEEKLQRIKYLTEKKNELRRKIIRLDLEQQNIKIFLNSAYGTYANKYSPFYDIDMAASITETGQAVIKQAASIVNKFFVEENGLPDKDYIIYGDTDSCVSSTIINTNKGDITIGELFDQYQNEDTLIIDSGHEIQLIDKNCNLQSLTFDSKNKEVKYGNIKNIIRHKVSKKKYRIKAGGKEVIMTEDHGCMVYRDGQLLRVSPSDIRKTDKMVVCGVSNTFKIVDIEEVEEIGSFDDEYVYDIEMDDDTEHTFFANSILVHNSIYLAMKDYLVKHNIPVLKENGDVTEEFVKETDTLQSYINDKINDWARNVLHSTDPRYFFKRESICDAGLFLEKKRYILSVRYDGKRHKHKFKYVGVEVQRSTYSAAIKTMMKDIIMEVFRTKDRLKSDAKYRECYERFKELPIDEIAFRSSIKDYEKYASQSDGFKIALHTPIHVKSAIYYNTLLETLKLKAKYQAIVSGTKIKYIYTGQNKYGIKCIGFNDTIPEEFDIKVDVEKMFESLVAPCIERVYNSLGWQLPDMRRQYQCDFLELFGL